MLGILIPYASFYQFEDLQIQNIKRYVKCPYKIFIVKSTVHAVPSVGHMNNLNALLDDAWDQCDSFLLFDNDMIFLDDFHEPEEDCWFLPQTRSGYTYAWPNLMYFKKNELMRRIWFENDSDSGGTSWRYLASTENKREITYDGKCFGNFEYELERLCDCHGMTIWTDRFRLGKTNIYHFRALSNWTKWPIEFQKAKEELILRHVARFMDTPGKVEGGGSQKEA